MDLADSRSFIALGLPFIRIIGATRIELQTTYTMFGYPVIPMQTNF